MTNWASDVITETASASGRDPVEANRVTLTVAGGPVVVQWSLSYTAHANTPFRSRAEARLCSHPSRCVARARWRRDRTLDARRSGPGPLAADRATFGLGDRERPVRRPRIRLRAQDLRLEGVEQGFRRQRQHARPDLRGALIACRPPPLSGAGQGRQAGYLIAGVPAGAANSSSGAHAASDSGRGSGQALRRGGRGRPPQLRGAGRFDHGAARRERRGQDHHDRDDTGLLAASAGRVTVLGEEVPRHRSRCSGDELPRPRHLPLGLSPRQNLLVYADLIGSIAPTRACRAGERSRSAGAARSPDRAAVIRPKTRLMLAKALINRPELCSRRAYGLPRSGHRGHDRGYLERYQRAHGATLLPPHEWPRSSGCARTC